MIYVPVPDGILKIIRCNCKMTSHNTGGTNLWTCKSNGLKCVIACENCKGYNCSNSNFSDCEIAETDTDPSLNE